jgi:pantoate--beta-alanine ligase
MMDVIHTVEDMRAWACQQTMSGRRVGFVPTMGYLHEGHLALLRFARARCDALVLSIFVNPTQFGPSEDFEAYPRDEPGDLALARSSGVDVAFLPAVDQIYPPGYRTFIEVESLQDGLCGRSRPGHFRGVCTVVARLFRIVSPHEAFFGEKDAQQLRIIRRMVVDLEIPVAVVGHPTVREPDGLAMSSRNVYLGSQERAQAPALYRSLRAARERVEHGEGDVGAILAEVKAAIEREAPLARLEYVEAVEDETLRPVGRLEGRVLLAVAARFGRARLIDNIVLEPGREAWPAQRRSAREEEE